MNLHQTSASNPCLTDVPVRMSARQLHKLLQDSADESTSGYLNAGDFTVTEDLNSCYEHVWTLSWTTQTGDLPNFIRVGILNPICLWYRFGTLEKFCKKKKFRTV